MEGFDRVPEVETLGVGEVGGRKLLRQPVLFRRFRLQPPR